jgi:hypothetical protein
MLLVFGKAPQNFRTSILAQSSAKLFHNYLRDFPTMTVNYCSSTKNEENHQTSTARSDILRARTRYGSPANGAISPMRVPVWLDVGVMRSNSQNHPFGTLLDTLEAALEIVQDFDIEVSEVAVRPAPRTGVNQ